MYSGFAQLIRKWGSTSAKNPRRGELESWLPNFAPEVEIDRQGGPDNVCFAPLGESQMRNVVSMQGHLGYRDRIYRAAYRLALSAAVQYLHALQGRRIQFRRFQ